MSAFTPTDEQQAALDLFTTGESMVIEAGAGTGKTSTLRLLARSTRRRGRYLAFNKSIAGEARASFPTNVECSTAHALAYAACGLPYRNRMGGVRLRGYEIANRLDIRPFGMRYGAQSKVLQAGFLAGFVMRGIERFCQSADAVPTARHFPYIDGIDVPTARGERTFENNMNLRDHLSGALEDAWADIVKVNGSLPFKHEHYLKLWQLSHPTLPVDFILFDEAQDANPVMAAVVAEQTHAQRIYVGDANQAIYEFTGAVNALAAIDSEHRRRLTQSFRFGPPIAAVANKILGRLGADLRLVGSPLVASQVGEWDMPDAILCRTNATAIEKLLGARREGRSVHLVGGGKELAWFVRSARDLIEGKGTSYPDLACFTTWDEVTEYVQNDPQGSDLKLFVDLIEEFGVAQILGAIDASIGEADAEVVVSTAHKAKGREWSMVQLAGDFVPFNRDLTTAELRLLYVACTRARHGLDESAVRSAFDRPKAIPLPAVYVGDEQ